MTKRTEGFSLVEILIIIITLVIIGGIGYLAYTNFVAKPSAGTESSANDTASQSSDDTVTVDSGDDLDKVTSELDSTSLDDSDSSELDAATKGF